MILVNQQRLWDSLMEMATIGATAHGGSCRLALTDDDARAGAASSHGARQPAARSASIRSATCSRAGPARSPTCRP